MANELEKLVQDKVERIENVPKEFLTKVEKEQLSIYKKILRLIDKTKRDSNGFIILNDANIDLLNEINNEVVSIVRTSDYKDFVNDFIKEFDGQLDINNEYFDNITGGVTVVPKDSEQIVALYKRGALNDLLSKQALMSEFAKPINDLFKKAVTTEGSFVDLTESLRTIVVGDSEKQGKLRKYAGQIAWDAFAVSDRAYTKQLSEANDMEWFRYAGGLVEDSRPFCMDKNGGYYHKKEVENWGKQKQYNGTKYVKMPAWKGMIEGTTPQNIFTNLGGHRCLHSLIPVPISVVPKKDIQRCLDLGFIKLSDKKKKSLKVL